MMRVLNVGGGSKSIPIPAYYAGWEHVLLDIDPKGGPDLCCDARELGRLPGGQFDAVYCSHNLEHYYAHFTDTVLRGFAHVLKVEGFADVRVPDLAAVMAQVVAAGLDLDDTLYVSPLGPITAKDVFYGYGKEIAESGNEYYAHKTGFTDKTLAKALRQAGFKEVFLAKHDLQIDALAFLREPGEQQVKMLGL
jgi:ubiquinone/menaquinone biosynthesis C-methylase UbiE